ncbi:spore coat protein GerQ [Robertmurraya yapensis]|uniref:Spore coat protein GerQ n=2 Tax=Bacillaceae TaxID=186817 RepID=A0A3S0K0P7_9BACI|nr:spore coat protein GerQ [Bacillus yapensis]RTR33048.1 spore coat protein GerQ [Bacillus yapensis]TKS96871.1 spore coat protein GerQ [Bacillus yapensis]
MTYNPYYYARQGAYGYQPSYGAGQTQPVTPPVATGTFPTAGAAQQVPGQLPLEQSYIENILRLNRGKLATVYAMFDTVSAEGPSTQVFRGIIEAAGRDHLILSDPESGRRYLIPMVYFGYATFDEELEYEYPYAAAPATAYPPR